MKTYLFAGIACLTAMRCFAADTDTGGGGLPLVDPTAPAAGPADAASADTTKAAEPAAAPAPKPRRAAAAAAAALDDGLVEATVRRGHVDVGTFAEPNLVGPGGTVRLDAKTVERLRADGVLVDPDAAELPEWKGPTVGAA